MVLPCMVYVQNQKKCKLTVTGDSSGLSPVSSDPLRVCICDKSGKPQCNNTEYIYMNQTIHPGERFTVPAVVVGWDFGTTVGVVYTGFHSDKSKQSLFPMLDSNSQNGHVISNSKWCTDLSFILYANHTPENVTMYLTALHIGSMGIDFWYAPDSFNVSCTENDLNCFHVTPIYFSIMLLPCPPGFKLLSQRCDCYLVLLENCTIINGIGYFSWSTNAWVSTFKGGMLYDTHCPFGYCSITGKWIDLQNDPDSQCAFNHAGRLCGGCKENCSLAIGSSHCIPCHDNNNLALLIFFAAAGLLLVFFISTLNLTVTQGMVNGLIFYANVIWTYQSIFFPQGLMANAVLTFLKIFTAWVNLDFGIETCFVIGLTAFWKTWLQFVFPLYVWCVAGLIIVAAKYSSRLTNLLGNKAVPVLATLFLLSYTKLLRTIESALEFSNLVEDSNLTNISKLTVWSVDGNLTYLGFPHILLFVVGLATLLFLWLPYTLLLLLMQWLRRLSHFRLLKWVTRLHPVYDAYSAPLKHKHQYWFGVLLLIRGILLVIFTSVFNISQNTTLLILLTFGVMLIFCIAALQPYNSTAVLILQTSFFVNLTLLSGFILYSSQTSQPTLQAIAVGLSTGLAFQQFCGIVMYATIIPRCCSKDKLIRCCDYDSNKNEPVTDVTDSYFVRHQEAQPLLTAHDIPT